MEAALGCSIPREEVNEEVAEDEACEGEDEKERRVLQGVPVERLPSVVDEVIDGGGSDSRDDTGCDGEKPP
jgi:hypothetical protein